MPSAYRGELKQPLHCQAAKGGKWHNSCMSCMGGDDLVLLQHNAKELLVA